MQNKLAVTVGASACGLFAGLLLASGGIKGGLIKALSLAGLGAIPPVFLTHLILDTRFTRKLNDAEGKVFEYSAKLDKSKSKIAELEDNNRRLTRELTGIQQTLSKTILDRDVCRGMIETLKPSIEQLERDLAASKSAAEELQAECDEWESEFQSRVAVEANRQFQEAKVREMQRLCQENDAITTEAMTLLRRLQTWGVKVAQGHSQKREIITSLASAYNTNIDEANALFNKERDQYLTQIELLNERIGLLQHELAGDLVEPEYLECGYANEGAIANDIAREVWRQLKIPLAVKGYQVRPDGSTDVGYGYSRTTPVEALVADLNRHSDNFAKTLRINKITTVRKHEISDLIVLSFRREPALKESGAKLLAGTAEEFLKYIVGHPIRYRLIADPGEGKTPTTAVMLSAILKEGCRRGNTSRGKKVPHTLVSVSYPGAQSSLKDSDYPLDRFLKYGTTTAAIKSFDDALVDWEYRQQNVKFAEEFFQIRVWDELDNTINSADDPTKCSDALKKILKQGGHSNIGWIVSGQSVMTSQIKGFRDDDRSLFTEIIIGIPKIRMYVKKYARGKNSDANLAKLERNLDDLEGYIESTNERVTDEARLLRIALVIDEKSPKLYFLPNLDIVSFDEDSINESENKASGSLLRITSQSTQAQSGSKPQNAQISTVFTDEPNEPFPAMQGVAHCPHCGNPGMTFLAEKRYKCKPCGKKITPSKVVFK